MSETSFNFSDYPPTQWESQLSQIKSQGIDVVRSWIRWGAHERSFGIRDFSSSSRLRLERFLRLCQDAHLSVRLSVGFDPHVESIPDWTYLRTSERSLVFSKHLGNVGDDLEIVRIPSLWAKPIREAFVSYLSELLDLVGLYLTPEGPVSKVRLELGPYENDLNWLETNTYANELGRRFSSIDTLNLRYGVAFKDFGAAASRRGFRTAVEKRPWLAAHDFQFAQELAKTSLMKELKAASPDFPWERLDPARGNRAEVDAPVFAYDSTLLQIGNDGTVLPLCPSAAIHPYYFQFYNLVRRSIQLSRRAGWSARPVVELSEVSASTPILFLNSKYIQREDARLLEKRIREGGRVLFLGGLPKFDEHVSPIHWNAKQGVEQDWGTVGKMREVRIGGGTAWVPAKEIESAEQVVDRLPALFADPARYR